VEEVVPVGVSVCVAGHYLFSSKSPTITASIVAFSKKEIVDKFKWPFLVLSLLQVICGGIAIYAGIRLSRLNRRQQEEQHRYEGVAVEAGRECKICLTNPCDVILEPCKHMCCCRPCSLEMADCPMCRKAIEGRTNVFVS